MPGVTPTTYASRLQTLQSAQEAAWGTALPATAKWMGLAPYPSFKPMVKAVAYDEDRGSLQNSFVASVLELGGEYSLNWQYASYEDINFALMNVLQAVTPSGGGPYVYTYLAPTTAVNSLTSYTMEWGYDILTAMYAGCIGQKMTIKGESKKQWEVSLSGFYRTFTPNAAVNIVSSTNASPIVITTAGDPFVTGQQVVIANHLINTGANGKWTIIRTGAGTYSLTGSVGNGVGGATGTITRIQTPAIADRVVNAILFPITTLAIEAANGTPGTTPYTNALLSFNLDVENNVQPIWTGDSLNATNYAFDRVKMTLTLKLLWNAQVKAWVEGTLMQAARSVIQLKAISGTNSAEIDFAGVLVDDPTRYTNDNGATAIEVKLESQLDLGSLANSLKVIITNSLAALP